MPVSYMNWDLDKDFEAIRRHFPILNTCTYLISNSLGAVPARVESDLRRYYELWAERGVSAWRDEWWDLSGRIGDKVAPLLGAGGDEVTMLPNATTAHWAALSTEFRGRKGGNRRIVMTDLDFPSTIYAVSQIASFMGWKVEIVSSGGRPELAWRRVAERIDDATMCVAISHVGFKSAFIQDVRRIAEAARSHGAFSLIDGYHAPGTLPVDVKALGVEFYVGGCLKWLCGGPGNAFLYADPDFTRARPPALTGWLGHKHPFRFQMDMDYTGGAYRFMSGTPPVPCLYTAEAGLDIIRRVGIMPIRRKSIRQTERVIQNALERGFRVFSPREPECRGGAVSLGLPDAFQVKQALDRRNIKVDFRRGESGEPDVIRVGPHFYTRDHEIDSFFQAVDGIYKNDEHRKFPKAIDHVT